MYKVELTPPTKAIDVMGLTKYFNNCRALRGINLEVNHGKSIVMLVPNGVGLTTLIKVLAAGVV